MSKDYYEILGVEPNATAKEIKQAYWRESAKHHPDKGGNEQLFKRVSDAYSVLSHPKKRKMYDNGEDPNDFKDNKEIAKERICTLVGSLVHHHSFMADHTDLITRLKEEINEISRKYYDEIEENELLIRRYNGVIRNLDNAEFIYAYMVESRARVEEKIAELNNDLEIQEIMHEILKDEER